VLERIVGWFTFIQQFFRTAFHRKQLNLIDDLTPLENQTRRDVWEAVRKYVLSFLERTRGSFSLKDIKQEYEAVRQIYDEGAREIREALSELSTIRNENPSDNEEILYRLKEK
jgi:EH domain-containing protein 1